MAFFEPDVVVEAEAGLAASIGFGALADDQFESQLLHLDDFFSDKWSGRPDIRYGLSVLDAYSDIYDTQRQFVLRDESPAFTFNETKLTPIVEAIFGAFPARDDLRQFEESYSEVFKPTKVDVSSEHWLQLFRDAATTPFIPTHHKIEIIPNRRDGLSFFFFDHTKPTDLIEYWNARLFNAPLCPVPMCWVAELSEVLREMTFETRRATTDGSRSIKSRCTLFFARSINQTTAEDAFRAHLSSSANEVFNLGRTWHPRVANWWNGQDRERHKIEVSSSDFETTVSDDLSIDFPSLAPNFADRYGGAHHRWANVIQLRSFDTDALALTYPTNLEDRTSPRLQTSLLERPIVSREGWVIGQQFKDIKGYLLLSDGTTAISEWLDRQGIRATLSSAGKVAKQMIDGLGGLRGARMLADKETVKLLNHMANQEPDKSTNDGEQKRQYAGRTVSAGRWHSLINKDQGSGRYQRSLDTFTKKGVLKLGLGVACANCDYDNWYGLDELDYELVCERCLKSYHYPQGSITPRWKYRVVGPFSVPNFAQGAYTVALTLAVFRDIFAFGPENEMTYSTGLDLKHDAFLCEVDFAFWQGTAHVMRQREEPRFVIGEAKSFGGNAITEADIGNLRKICQALPGTVAVISVLKNSFSDNEKRLLEKFARWGWKVSSGRIRAPVILLTGVELFSDFGGVRKAWKAAGHPYPENVDHGELRDLEKLAFSTQRIHLGLDYQAEKRAYRKKQSKRK